MTPDIAILIASKQNLLIRKGPHRTFGSPLPSWLGR